MQAKILGRSRVVRACVLAATTVLAGGVRAGAQAPDQRIWDGVFTGEQAQRGKPQFETNCGACHGAPGAGGSDRSGPTLIGDRFMRAWEFSGLNQFVSKVFDQMPQGFPSNVEDSVKLDIIAYLLQSNGFPPGSKELGADLDELREIQIVRKGGAQNTREPANFSLVQVVGCLKQDPDKLWIVTKSSEAMATTSPDSSSAQMLRTVQDTPPGAATFQLVNVSRLQPESHQGQRVEAKGLLYKEQKGSRISVSSLQMVAPSCGN